MDRRTFLATISAVPVLSMQAARWTPEELWWRTPVQTIDPLGFVPSFIDSSDGSMRIYFVGRDG
jgi:hypothetical protein